MLTHVSRSSYGSSFRTLVCVWICGHTCVDVTKHVAIKYLSLFASTGRMNNLSSWTGHQRGLWMDVSIEISPFRLRSIMNGVGVGTGTIRLVIVIGLTWSSCVFIYIYIHTPIRTSPSDYRLSPFKGIYASRDSTTFSQTPNLMWQSPGALEVLLLLQRANLSQYYKAFIDHGTHWL